MIRVRFVHAVAALLFLLASVSRGQVMIRIDSDFESQPLVGSGSDDRLSSTRAVRFSDNGQSAERVVTESFAWWCK